MNVVSHPNPALTQRASEVDCASDTNLRDLVGSMAQVMYGAQGIGLAATQVGVMKRVVVYDMGDESPDLVAICNPVITSFSEETQVDDEGCLSLPGISVPVERSVAVVCEAESINGRQLRIEAEGLHARLLQHEIDHLDGVLMIDRATPEERKAALQRYREAVALGAKPGQTSI